MTELARIELATSWLPVRAANDKYHISNIININYIAHGLRNHLLYPALPYLPVFAMISHHCWHNLTHLTIAWQSFKWTGYLQLRPYTYTPPIDMEKYNFWCAHSHCRTASGICKLVRFLGADHWMWVNGSEFMLEFPFVWSTVSTCLDRKFLI